MKVQESRSDGFTGFSQRNDKIREMRVLKTQHTVEAKSFETVGEGRKEQRSGDEERG